MKLFANLGVPAHWEKCSSTEIFVYVKLSVLYLKGFWLFQYSKIICNGPERDGADPKYGSVPRTRT